MEDYRIIDEKIAEWLSTGEVMRFRKVLNKFSLAERVIIPVKSTNGTRYRNIYKEYRLRNIRNVSIEVYMNGFNINNRRLIQMVRNEELGSYENDSVKALLRDFHKMGYTKIEKDVRN